MSNPPIDLLQGTVDVLILRTLAWEPMHGYGVSRFIRERTEGVLTIESAALYQALHRLERKKWIQAEWGVSENNRRAKFYSLTADGRKQLRTETATWRTSSRRRADLEDELRFYFDMRARELVEQGMSEPDARREAVREFGDLEYTKRYCLAEDAMGTRDDRTTDVIAELRQDIA